MALDSEFFVKLGLKATNFKKGLKDAGGDVDELGRKLGGLEKDTGKATKGLDTVGKSAKTAAVGTKSFTVSLKAIKGAIISTGIGLLVVALGEVVANWKEIVSFLDVAAQRTKILNDLSQQQEDFSNERLKTLRLQNDLIKLQGGNLDDNVDKQKKELTYQLGIALAAKDRLASEIAIAKANVNKGTIIRGASGEGVLYPASTSDIAERETAVLGLEQSLEQAQQRTDLLQKSIIQLLKDPEPKKTTGISAALGLPKAGEIDNLLQDSLDKQVAAGKRAADGLSKYILDSEKLTAQSQVEIRQDVDEKLLEQKEEFLTALQQLDEDAGAILQNGLIDGFSGIGEALGTSLVEGTNVIQAVGGELLGAIGSFLQDLGKATIAAGVAGLALKLAITNPLVAIGVGTALVALGSALSSASSAVDSLGSGASGASENAGGGVSRTTFSGSGTGGDFNGRVTFEIAGDKLIGVLNNTSLGGLRVGDNELITTG